MNGDAVSEARLRFHEVSKSFGDVLAVDDLELSLFAGEMVTLLGPSGCGKTTALRMAAGLERPDAGTVVINGVDVTTVPPERRGIGMVFQDYSLFPHLTVVDNAAFGLRVRGVGKNDARQEALESLDMLQIRGLATRFPHQISGGQKQRVALARAITVRPQILLLDEPLSALDAKVRAELRDEIRELQREQGFSALFVTHDQEEALSISDRVVVMRGGRVEQIGSPQDVYRSPRTEFVASFVGQMNAIPGTVVDARSVEIGGCAYPLETNEAVNSTVVVMIRPESVVVVRRGHEGSMACSVVARSFMGSHMVVDLAPAGERDALLRSATGDRASSRPIRAVVGPRDWQEFAIGDVVGVVLDDRAMSVAGTWVPDQPGTEVPRGRRVPDTQWGIDSGA